jgi:hypothetical protein
MGEFLKVVVRVVVSRRNNSQKDEEKKREFRVRNQYCEGENEKQPRNHVKSIVRDVA